MTAVVRSGKAQNERMFFRFGPQSGHRGLSSMCPLGAVRALRAAALHDGAMGESGSGKTTLGLAILRLVSLARTRLARPICGAIFDRTTLAYGHHEDRSPTHGYEPTREAAMAAFAKSWRND